MAVCEQLDSCNCEDISYDLIRADWKRYF